VGGYPNYEKEKTLLFDKTFNIAGFSLNVSIEAFTVPVGISASLNVYPSAPLTVQLGVHAVLFGINLTLVKGSS